MGGISTLKTLELNTDPSINWIDPPLPVVQQGTNAVLQFLRDAYKDATLIFRSKIMLVGEENVGKSLFAKCLKCACEGKAVSKAFKSCFVENHLSTDGIDIQVLAAKLKKGTIPKFPDQTELLLDVWDFAGQEVYYSTHQMFISRRSVFVLLWNITKDPEKSRLRYWLQSMLEYD